MITQKLTKLIALVLALAFFTQKSNAQCTYAINEPNNNMVEASPMPLNSDVRTGIGYNGDVDYYRLTINSQGVLNVVLSELPADYDIALLDSYGEVIVQSLNASTNSESILWNITSTGTYYLYLWGYNGANSTSCYRLANYFYNDCYDQYEYNDTRDYAQIISANALTTAFISRYEDHDWYQFSTYGIYTNVKITLSNLLVDYDLELYDQNGNLLRRSQYGSNTDEVITYVSSQPATYYVRVYSWVYNTVRQCYKLDTYTSNAPFARISSESAEKSPVKTSDAQASIYPNPATSGEMVYIESSSDNIIEGNIRILDAQGQLIMEKEVSKINGQSAVSLEGILPGLYIIDAGEEGKHKVVVK